MQFNISVNGKPHTVDVDADTPLLWVLRDSLKLTGTKFGCGIAQCGACTVHLNGRAQRSCIFPIQAVGDSKVTTIEGLSSNNDHPVQKAWVAEEVPQCGYCQPGMIMAASAMLNENENPSDGDIEKSITNVCRCGTYNRIRKAIKRAATA